MGDGVKQILDISTPLILAALFVINLLIKNDQGTNKAELLAHQNQVKDELKNEQAILNTKVEAHIARDEAFQEGLGRTLDRIDRKLDKT
jgi:uncharacterized protein HemX